MTKYRLIVNPAAGDGASERFIPKIDSLLANQCLDYDLVRTERPWHAVELAYEAVGGGYDIVVAVGGDSTVNEVLNGLMKAKQGGMRPSAMGVLGVGRGNDFAYGVGIPSDLEEGCRVLAQGYRRTIDVGRVVGGLYPQGRYFDNCVGIGFDAVGSREAAKITWLSGFPSYLIAVLKTVFIYYKAPLITIQYDGETVTQRSLLVSIMNGQRLGGGFLMAPQGEPDDGLFDICFAEEVSRLRIFSLIPHFVRGTQGTQKPIRTWRASHIVITAIEGALPAHTDGEMLSLEGRRLEVDLLPHQIDVVCQRPLPGGVSSLTRTGI